MKIVVISGVAGFIGSALAESYLKNQDAVIGLDNFLTGLPDTVENLKKHFPEKFRFIHHDVAQAWNPLQDLCSTLLKKYTRTKLDTVFHLASPASPPKYLNFPFETIQANTTGLLNALTFADEFEGRVVFSSTSEVYGTPQHEFSGESDPGMNLNSFSARACYFESKRLGEAILFSHNLTHHKTHGIVRLFNTYGPHMLPDDGRVIPNFVTAALKNGPIEIFGDGTRTRSFCYIDDCISGIRKYAESGFNLPMNIGNDHEVTMLELAQKVIKLTHSKSEIQFRTSYADDPLRRRPNLELAKKVLQPWLPLVELDEGLRRVVRTYSQINKSKTTYT